MVIGTCPPATNRHPRHHSVRVATSHCFVSRQAQHVLATSKGILEYFVELDMVSEDEPFPKGIQMRHARAVYRALRDADV
eukprot:m.454570 g.454570  ORF g.454570 m.454570 type:complete len:80 (+) comp20326_c2_seq60:5803-6042(+)